MTELLAAIRQHRLGLFVLTVGLLIAWAVWSARSALPVFIIGLALAFVLDPVVTWLERRGLPRWSGVLIAYVGLIALVWLLVAFAVPPVARQTRDFIRHLPELGATVTNLQDSVIAWYRSLDLPVELRNAIDQSIQSARAALGDALRDILAPALGTLLRTAGFLVGLIVVPVWLFYVLKDREAFPRTVAAALPETWQADVRNVLAILARVGGRWVRGELLLGLAIFAATLVGLMILTLAGFREFGEFTLILALIAGVLEWFPVIGPIISAVPAVLIGLSISPAAAIAVLVLYFAIQQLENNLLVPRVLGGAVELHPAVMIVALVAGGALFGIGGAVLAAPTVAAGRDLYRYTFHRLRDVDPEVAMQLAIHRLPSAAGPAEIDAQEA
jgi:predicted PurR-regulated permease PerM